MKEYNVRNRSKTTVFRLGIEAFFIIHGDNACQPQSVQIPEEFSITGPEPAVARAARAPVRKNEATRRDSDVTVARVKPRHETACPSRPRIHGLFVHRIAQATFKEVKRSPRRRKAGGRILSCESRALRCS
ncbi:hypothetical protein Sfum_2088 [Syntrophobacter fumaroxidans MPOB]|uniref:Uncharacterized protein n=1 Tax=Syntrophobacter fumaroxidans (strain DSM 10017 / MPOB) TaxID=335543 RepID=A0LK19_SYNFM|nr:hypothetical protein Sfum_2088 [Syntrophobacter fumaroxidans MPOB]